MFKCNIGNTDKLIRLIIGIVIVVLGLYFKSWWGVIGLIPLVTAGICWCPLYSLLKINTCGKNGCKCGTGCCK